MAAVVSNKTQDFNYHVQRIQSFLMKYGRVQAVLSNTVLQPDQKEHLISLLKATAAKLGDNVTVRQSPAYSSQSQGSVERFHRTLMGQVRTLKAQLDQQPTSNHTVACSTFSILAQQMCNTNGNISSYRRWGEERRTPLCEFGETVLYQLPHVKDLPKLENRFLAAIWLGKGTDKFPTASTAVPVPASYKPPQRTQESASASTPVTGEQTTEQQQQPRLPIADSPMATASTHQHQRPALSSPKRTLPDDVAEASPSEKTRRQGAPTGLTRPDATATGSIRTNDHSNRRKDKERQRG